MAVGSSTLTALLQQVRRTILRHVLCPPGTRLLVALSGGSDSVALTLVLRELETSLGVTVVSLAHLNHGLRPTAARDQQFCTEFSAATGLPILVTAVDVLTYAQSERLSVEEAARRARYTFLHRAAADVGADRIAVGHTRDDQAETVLQKLIRGAGLTGLGGIYPRRGVLIRPLLEVPRADLRAYLGSRRQPWVEDESNASLDNPRNRIRHRVLPELDLAYGGAAASIARAAGAAGEDGQWLDGLATARLAAIATPTPDGLAFDAALLASDPGPVRRRVLLQAMRTLAGGREVGHDHVEAALDVLSGRCPGTDVPGCRVELRRGKLVLLGRGPG